MLAAKILNKVNYVRSGVYFLESLPLRIATQFVAPADGKPPTKEELGNLYSRITKLHDRETELISAGVYPISALEIENPWRHMRSYAAVMRDGVRLMWRMRNQRHDEFSSAAAENKEGLPKYYTRNFHFQTDGYLSEASARIYDHQVEVLFAGTAGAQRRVILPVLKKFANANGRWLEIGCGSGSATRSVLETFPNTKVTALDLSGPYLKVAQENLRRYRKVDFVQGDGTNLDFKSETFDAIYSVYVLHELPRPERGALIREAYRALKPGGILALADSIQKDDDPGLNWSLEAFPKVYHEPFYKEYTTSSLEKMMKQVTGQEAQTEMALSTKVVWVQKPLDGAAKSALT